jgi:hypothetical protein
MPPPEQRPLCGDTIIAVVPKPLRWGLASAGSACVSAHPGRSADRKFIGSLRRLPSVLPKR